MNDKKGTESGNNIRLLVMDVDGTLTDGKVYMSADGELVKAFNIKDGCGIKDILPTVGIVPVVITGRMSKIVENRCRELNVEHCYQGCRDKAAKLREVAELFGLSVDKNGIYREIAYIGDDINDLPCMRLCGLVGCTADAACKVRNIADFVSSHKGGDGAVREFIECIIR